MLVAAAEAVAAAAAALQIEPDMSSRIKAEVEARRCLAEPVLLEKVAAAALGRPAVLSGAARARRNLAEHALLGGGAAAIRAAATRPQRAQRGRRKGLRADSGHDDAGPGSGDNTAEAPTSGGQSETCHVELPTDLSTDESSAAALHSRAAHEAHHGGGAQAADSWVMTIADGSSVGDVDSTLAGSFPSTATEESGAAAGTDATCTSKPGCRHIGVQAATRKKASKGMQIGHQHLVHDAATGTCDALARYAHATSAETREEQQQACTGVSGAPPTTTSSVLEGTVQAAVVSHRGPDGEVHHPPAVRGQCMVAEVNKAIDVGPEASDGKGPDIRSVMEETQELLQRLTRKHAADDAARALRDGGPAAAVWQRAGTGAQQPARAVTDGRAWQAGGRSRPSRQQQWRSQ